ncbi:MAG: N-6 DNA methylase [Candidatus Eisenbacteria bacterium]|nr:N-6 DNA methylase [Candidatus Eisenbacteria bacterium]
MSSTRPTQPVADQLALLDDPTRAGSAPAASAVPAYTTYYKTLVALREEFHRTGRYDDANTKLDEIVKLLVMRFHEERRHARGLEDRFSADFLSRLAAKTHGDPARVARALRTLSQETLRSPEYANPDGTSVFGADPCLSIQPTDDAFAVQIVNAVRALAVPTGAASGAFDILNESFGHFVRDSFRNHMEDAQYMTPQEVVEAMAAIALADVEADSASVKRLLEASGEEPFLVLDPTCGVGSFLVEALRRMLRVLRDRGLDTNTVAALTEAYRNACVRGQDKVDRMVRLTKLNLMLFGGGGGSVWQGNSILNGSALDDLQGRVDLILTNPPFGARYRLGDVLAHQARDRYPMLHDLAQAGRAPTSVDSEVVLLDRCLSLLRPGGRLLIVLPDSVVSGRGFVAVAREWIEARADLIAVVELPAETFAQAGTRTKTCFAYLRKRDVCPSRIGRVFMAVCDDIGFRVVARAGASLKIQDGTNQLPAIVDAYLDTSSRGSGEHAAPLVASREPSAVWVPRDSLLNGRWTPNFYRARRLEALTTLRDLQGSGYELHTLASIARLASRSRRRVPVPAGAKTISVLHVSQDGAINFREVASYSPKFPGLPCRPGDVLISKINPHIPRVCVVPEAEYPLACSSEFEILEPVGTLESHLLAAILVSPSVQTQIECLTSGTSSSHNRIKDTELAEVLVPLPRRGSALDQRFTEIGAALRRATAQRYEADALALQELKALAGAFSVAISDRIDPEVTERTGALESAPARLPRPGRSSATPARLPV